MKIVTSVLCLCLATVYGTPYEKTELRMPGIQSPADDTYLCRTIPLDTAKEHNLVGFEPHASMHTAHHMLLYGCAEPGIPAGLDEVWDCGEMSHGGNDFSAAPTCASGPQIIYAWARDAPSLGLPEGVGFKVGGETGIKYLVLQVHYMHKTSEPDFSGITIESTDQQMPKTAATLLMVTGGEMAPHTKEHFETACVIDEDVVMHPFAFRTHTHSHGKMVSGWKIIESEDGTDNWQLIGKMDPMKPQMFYPVEDKNVVLRKGDIIASRCTMENNEDHVVEVGATGADEMCNFYMMYWVDSGRVLKDNTCFSAGPPNYHWGSEAGLNHIPEKQADQA